jgi:ankyrin repeat protein
MLCAARDGDLTAVQELAARDPQLLECEFEYRRPLHFAVRFNRLPVVRYLLEHGADPTYGYSGESLPNAARTSGFPGMADWLDGWLEERYGISEAGRSLARRIRERELSGVMAAIEADPGLVRAADDHGSQPLHWAAMTRQLPLIDFLLSHGADIDCCRPDGARPIDLTNGDYYYRGWRDLAVEALRPPAVVAGYLLAKGAAYDLTVAARLGDCDRARQLLDADPGLINQVRYSSAYTGAPLRCAAAAGQRAMVRLLLERGADPNTPEPVAPWGGALREAVGHRDVESVRLLLDHGANPNSATESSGNCLWAARGHEEIAGLLESRGATIPLYLAAYDGDTDRLKTLLERDPDLPITEEAIHNAVSEGKRPFLELLLQHRPDSLRGVRLGDTADVEFARWLLASGMDAAAANWVGITALHRFAARGLRDMVDLCLDAGADPRALDDETSSTPAAWARRAGHSDLAQYLESLT